MLAADVSAGTITQSIVFVPTCRRLCAYMPSTYFQFASENDMAAMSAPGVRLITAASDGDKKGVKKWLDQGVDVDSRDWDNLTPLIAASSQGHLVRLPATE